MFSSPIMSPLSIAPMIDWTYMDFRVFMRMLAPYALLYTEMQTIGAVQHNPSRALLAHPTEKPYLAFQVGGADPSGLAIVAKRVEDAGFSEININLGCPSNKVQAGRFGACLMREPEHVASCIRAMKEAVSIPVSAKTRIGVDEDDSYEHFEAFVRYLVDAGCDKLIVHARKAWLNGLNPKQNRTIPPLHYDFVYRLKQQFKSIPIIINGNIQTMLEIQGHLSSLDGVMLGRLACQDPYAIAQIHHHLFPHVSLLPRSALFEQYINYIQTQSAHQKSMSLLFKPIMNLVHSLPGARVWKSIIMEIRDVSDTTLLKKAHQTLVYMEKNAI